MGTDHLRILSTFHDKEKNTSKKDKIEAPNRLRLLNLLSKASDFIFLNKYLMDLQNNLVIPPSKGSFY